MHGDAVSVPDPRKRIHLQLRRFAGCPICDRHLHAVATRHAEVEAAGIREVVVFHSTADELRKYEDDLPFAVVPDPHKKLYVELGVEAGPLALLDPRVWPTLVRAVWRSLVRVLSGKSAWPSLMPDGGRWGLPADFLLDRDGRVLALHYGEHAGDHWSVDELLALASSSDVAASEMASASALEREVAR